MAVSERGLLSEWARCGGSACRRGKTARRLHDGRVAVDTAHRALAWRLRRPEKKKAPEGAFNMLRLVRQAD
ncbi:hypothetical protein CVS37_03010 [Burkholderia lata]|nr:hypothetical protein CVS37_03010 [Burkholderia lata]